MTAEPVEAPPETQPQPTKGKPFRFSVENARAYSVKGLAARRSQAEDLKRRLEQVPELPKGEADPFLRDQLMRVRVQINAVNKLIDSAMKDGNAQALERLVRARIGLNEIERQHADRSLPAVRRVAEVKTGARSNLLSGLPD